MLYVAEPVAMAFPRSTERGPIEAHLCEARGSQPRCFPRSTERGPIEASAPLSRASRSCAFRVQQNAAPLKRFCLLVVIVFLVAFRVQQNAAPLKPSFDAFCLPNPDFPRSTERGPIEARFDHIVAHGQPPFRVQQNAAPLKQAGAGALRRVLALSAFNRTRPH